MYLARTQAEKEALVRQRNAFLHSLSWKARLWVRLRNLFKDYSNYHAPLEGWSSFFYPQRFVAPRLRLQLFSLGHTSQLLIPVRVRRVRVCRFVIGISLGLMILFYVFVGATVLIYYVIYLLVHSYNRLVAFEVHAQPDCACGSFASE
jgi:hypothetical protein